MSRVSGQVIEGGTSAPVADARVFVVLDDDRAAPGGSLPETLSDRDGRYRFDALPAGRYRIAAQKDGFEPPMNPSTMQMFEVAANQILDGLTVSLRRGGAFTGRVLDPHGRPIAGVGVTALLKRLNRAGQPAAVAASGAPLLLPSGQGQTNDLGEFRIFGLWPGEYVIVAATASKFGGAAAPPSAAATTTSATYFPGTGDVAAAQPVAVQSGETVSDLTITLVAVVAFKVSGVVVDADGAPVANAMVVLMGGHRGRDVFLSLVLGPSLMSQCDAGGRFTFGDVPAGAYTVRADAGGIGAFGFTDTFGIDSDGTPRADPSQPKPAGEPGTIEVTVENADVGDLRIVVAESR
jgi:Carboxypeptidase regulatory-like domain